MSIWAVYGYDDIYDGLHGMKRTGIYEGTEEEAMEYGRELADDVITSYPIIYNALEDSIREECEADGIEMDIGSEDEDAIRDEIYMSDMIYDWIELDSNKLPTLDIDELERIFYNNEDNFIKKYRLK